MPNPIHSIAPPPILQDKLRSLQLVDSHEYAVLYTDMKQRIGLDLVKV